MLIKYNFKIISNNKNNLEFNLKKNNLAEKNTNIFHKTKSIHFAKSMHDNYNYYFSL